LLNTYIPGKMRIISTTLFSTLAVLLLSSCLFLGPSVRGDGEVVEEVREVGRFNAVEVTSGMNVHFVQGDVSKVVVVADKNLLEIIETRVSGNVLEIKALANIWSASSKKVIITTNNLNEIQGTAGSNLYTDGRLFVEHLKLRASAGSNLKMDIEGQSVEVSVSSGANVYLEGKAKNLIVRTSSGANMKAEEFHAEISDIKVSSGANVWITTMKELTAHASSGGNIFYYGSPGKTNTSSSSGGNVSKRE
jgi:hypothetical protein